MRDDEPTKQHNRTIVITAHTIWGRAGSFVYETHTANWVIDYACHRKTKTKRLQLQLIFLEHELWAWVPYVMSQIVIVANTFLNVFPNIDYR